MEAALTQQKNITLSRGEKLMLVRLYNKLGYQRPAFEILRSMPATEMVQNFSPTDIVNLYISLHSEEEGIRIFEQAMHDNTELSTDISQTWALLAAATGKTDNLLDWMGQQKNLTREQLMDFYFLAIENKHPEAAEKVMEVVYKQDASPRNLLYLAEAAVQSKQYTKALKMLKETAPTMHEAEQLYLAALAGIIKEKGPVAAQSYQKDLDNFLKPILARASTTPQEKENLAYLLLDAGLRQKAEDIFLSLASDESAFGPHVEELVYLWGSNLKPAQLAWLKQRTAQAPAVEKAKWLGFLNDSGNPSAVIEILHNQTQDMSPEIADMYMESLQTMIKNSGNKELLADILRKELARTSDITRLKRLAVLAKDDEMTDLAQKAFAAVYHQNPQDAEALRELGVMHFNQGDYTEAEPLLSSFLAKREGDYEANYCYGEILWRKKDFSEAQNYYHRALSQIKKLQTPDLSAQIMLAQLLYRDDKVEETFAIFRKLLEKYPHHKGIRSNFSSLLIERGRYEEAGLVLSD
jgi:TolA-binding protein